jgi:hypothetical protein
VEKKGLDKIEKCNDLSKVQLESAKNITPER